MSDHTTRGGDRPHAPAVARAFVVAVTFAAGLAIAWIDSRPTWDDAGVTAAMVLVLSTAASCFGVSPWLSALVVAGPLLVPAFLHGNPGALVALAIAGVGGLVGASIRRAVRRG